MLEPGTGDDLSIASGARLRGRALSVHWIAALALFTVFCALALIRRAATSGTAVDHAMLNWMVEHRRPWLTSVALAITNAGSPIAVALLAAGMCAAVSWWTRSLWPALVVGVTVAGAAIASAALKVVVGAHRPPERVQLTPESDYSFPSGHVTGTVALLGIFAVITATYGSAAVRLCWAVTTASVAVIMAMTRLYLGVHWLTEVLGGLVLGSLAVLVGRRIWLARDNRRAAGIGTRQDRAGRSWPAIEGCDS
ncbi:phosphatase PAP2 family protein [Mycobacterium sp. CBMA271]|uniref:phosphatase PAP2 family protein n=1 Tax=unclassified Mycobacteroides TaxID=2618759 RepID=UPI0012DF04C9|nr:MULTISPECIES: phosphatase PAP2 family protein [unclassified Mycobacteroides]MUM18828.1 hypothetical protein [Mycobacteroides sp. CBMA 326]MUM23231.1 phosphatase PAP2 family protein [Mycobacteroides sp. CBMA 271]